MKSLTKLGALADRLELKLSLAQQQEHDYTLVDSIRKALGPAITSEVSNILNNRAVSSIPIRVKYNKPTATFVVSAMGSDAAVVNKEVSDLLNKKYSAKMAQMLAKAQEPSFEFGFLTVE